MEPRKKPVRQSIAELALFIALMVVVVSGVVNGQTKVSYSQSMYLMKNLMPSLQKVGIIGSTLTADEIQSLGRAAAGLGLKVSVAQVSDVRDIAGMYKRLVNEYHVDLIWIPDESDNILLGIGFEYLQESTIVDRVGLCVPTRQLVSKGALCSVEHDNGKLTVFINRRVASVDGIKSPTEQRDGVVYVLQ